MSNDREFTALFAAALDAVLIIDDARVFIDVNPATEQLLGSPRAKLVGCRFDQFVDPNLDLDAEWRTFLKTGQQTGELRLVSADGTVRDVEFAATAHFLEDRHLAILRDVSDRKQGENERVALLRRQKRQLLEMETLLAVSRTLSATLDPTETMRRVAREIAHALGADMAGAFLAGPSGDDLRPVAGYRVPKHMREAFQQFPIPIKNHAAIEGAWRARRAVWTDDMATDPRVDRDSFNRFPHQSDLFVPICIKDRPVGGFFVIWWTERRSITDDEVRLVQGISDLAGIFLDNAQLYRAAAEANRAKDEFLATLSHELRNPLGAIVAAVGALERRGGQDETASRLRTIIHRQSQRLALLVDDLLDVARVTAGKIALNRQPLDLGDVAANCLRSLRDGGQGLEHHITLSVEPAIVSADLTRLEQIITNLLQNAVKYTPPGGSIRIDVTREFREAVLRVTDTGRGIPSEMLSRVFELFAQAEQPIDRSLGGLGVGLTLTRRLVELHGGTITAFSDGEGRGAQFTVRLPVDVTVGPFRPPSEPLPHGRPRRILIIEDSHDARESLRLLLESQGHQVSEASDGTRGVAAALAEQPEVVLIDLGLPGLTGYEVARALRATPYGKSATLIAVTGYGQSDDRRRSNEAGFDAHLVKPVSYSALARLIVTAR
jgi:PAS domain S-box-containing protein